MSFYSFEDMNVWKLAMEIAERVFHLTAKLPRSEDYGLTSQIRRASLSISANIAEGYGRRSSGDYVRFLNISQGSINELQTHLILCQRVGLCNAKDIELILDWLQEETRMISALIKKLKP
jgi:four helix bundle protein